ncbi:Protein CBG27434 [Caenorhabditis briggsae]|uniref:Protein CBG27434 n=1 Tax=Caenorhabditis briggsae TaxID=6238 RepID=B6IK11_CAEBR|nr:Protein CBG27434 [Caenorhabditis briggsae]CAS00241.1 Protein CBG27434 [Caenorhabditis briggsae]
MKSRSQSDKASCMMDATNSNPPQVVAIQKKFTWTTAQRTRLSDVYQTSAFITQKMIDELAAELGVEKTKVELYFNGKRWYETKKANKERMRKIARDLPATQATNVVIPAIPAMPMGTANNGPPIAVHPALDVPHHGTPINWGNYQWGTPAAMPMQNQPMLGFDPLGYGHAHVGLYNANYANAPAFAPPAQNAMNWNQGFVGYQHGSQQPIYAGQVNAPCTCYCDGICGFFGNNHYCYH